MQTGSSCNSASYKKYTSFVGVSIVVGLIIATLSVIPQQSTQILAAYATHFFMGLVPVLVTAGLVKYLVC